MVIPCMILEQALASASRYIVRSCEKIDFTHKKQNAPLGNQRLAKAKFGNFQFFHSFSPITGVTFVRPNGSA
jgi:hypothetical protein